MTEGFFHHLSNCRYTTSRKEPAPTPPQRKIIEERMVMKETPPPAEEASPLRHLEPKQRITQEELTIEEVRRQPYSVPPPKNEYHYHEEILPPPDEYHFEEKRTDLLASAPDSMDSRKSRLLVMPWLNVACLSLADGVKARGCFLGWWITIRDNNELQKIILLGTGHILRRFLSIK